MEQPVVMAQPGATLSGEMRLLAHNRQSYDVHVTLRAPALVPGGAVQVGGGWRSPALAQASSCVAHSAAAGQLDLEGGLRFSAAVNLTGACPSRLTAGVLVLAPLLLLQEVRGKFDLKEPYYRQQVQWMMQMAQPAADGGSVDDAATLLQQQQQQAPPAVAQQQMDVS